MRRRIETGSESQFAPSAFSASKAIFRDFSRLLRMLSGPAETRRAKSGSAGFNCSMSMLCASICPASVRALRVSAAISESADWGVENVSDRSPEAASARVVAESVCSETLVGRMRSVRCLFRISMLSSAMRAA